MIQKRFGLHYSPLKPVGREQAEFLVVLIQPHALGQAYLPEVQVRACATVSYRQVVSLRCPLLGLPD